jgi:hypothetical protein
MAYMRTTIELPDNLLMRAKSEAALAGVSLKEFFISAIEQRLVPKPVKHRRPLPRIGDENDGPPLAYFTPAQIAEALSEPIPEDLIAMLKAKE